MDKTVCNVKQGRSISEIYCVAFIFQLFHFEFVLIIFHFLARLFLVNMALNAVFGWRSFILSIINIKPKKKHFLFNKAIGTRRMSNLLRICGENRKFHEMYAPLLHTVYVCKDKMNLKSINE